MSNISAQFTLDFGEFKLDTGHFELPGRGVTALFGHSGSGKTTLLRCIAGLEAKARGRLQFGDELWQDSDRRRFLPTHKRAIGYVFQDAALFPHMDVRRNLLYGYTRLPEQTRQVRLEEVVEWLGLGHLLERATARLSGGERQRVAIARALLTSPKLLLMDEPLSALDIRSKREILPYLERLHETLDIPVIYVTHAPAEVERLADTVVFMGEGRIRSIETLREATTRPDSPLFMDEGAASIIQASLAGHDEHYQLSEVRFGEQSVWLPRLGLQTGKSLRLRILARDVSLALQEPQDTSILNVLPVTVAELQPDGQGRLLVVCHTEGGQQLLAEITRKSADRLSLQEGQTLFAQIKAVAMME